MPRDAAAIESLSEKLHAMGHVVLRARQATVPTAWKAVDDALGGLPLAAVHEWFFGQAADSLPAVGLLLHMARQALFTLHGGSMAVWIGRRCWPNVADQGVLARRFILLDVADPTQRVWAAGLALRCPSVGCCVMDGEALTMAMTRRLQIAASAGHALALVARPGREAAQLSAAGTRWQVTPLPGPGPQWAVELLRWKGDRPVAAWDRPKWIVEPAPWP